MPDSDGVQRFELCWGTVEGADLLTLIEVAGGHGFGSITVSAPQYRAARAAGVTDSDLRRALERAGLTVGYVELLGTALPGAPRPAEVDARLRWVYESTEEELYAIADVLDASAITVVDLKATGAPLVAMAHALAGVAERAADHGLDVLVEFHPMGSIPDIATAAHLLAETDRQNVRIMLDTLHLSRSGGGLAEVVAHAPLIGGVQLSDRVATNPPPFIPMGDRLLPGDGQLPLADIVAAVRAAHREVPIGIEVFSERLRSLSPDAAAGLAAASLRTLNDVD